ncbi:MAG: hypothetical protein R3A13_09030 [Bdellovibrionota bacterium]
MADFSLPITRVQALENFPQDKYRAKRAQSLNELKGNRAQQRSKIEKQLGSLETKLGRLIDVIKGDSVSPREIQQSIIELSDDQTTKTLIKVLKNVIGDRLQLEFLSGQIDHERVHENTKCLEDFLNKAAAAARTVSHSVRPIRSLLDTELVKELLKLCDEIRGTVDAKDRTTLERTSSLLTLFSQKSSSFLSICEQLREEVKGAEVTTPKNNSDVRLKALEGISCLQRGIEAAVEEEKEKSKLPRLIMRLLALSTISDGNQALTNALRLELSKYSIEDVEEVLDALKSENYIDQELYFQLSSTIDYLIEGLNSDQTQTITEEDKDFYLKYLEPIVGDPESLRQLLSTASEERLLMAIEITEGVQIPTEILKIALREKENLLVRPKKLKAFLNKLTTLCQLAEQKQIDLRRCSNFRDMYEEVALSEEAQQENSSQEAIMLAELASIKQELADQDYNADLVMQVLFQGFYSRSLYVGDAALRKEYIRKNIAGTASQGDLDQELSSLLDRLITENVVLEHKNGDAVSLNPHVSEIEISALRDALSFCLKLHRRMKRGEQISAIRDKIFSP